jgi:hypothetical protein
VKERGIGVAVVIAVVIVVVAAGIGGYFVLKSRGEGTSKKLSQMLLGLGDLPSGYTLVEKGERLSSGGYYPPSQISIELGWIKGYYVLYTKTGTYGFTEIDQCNSIYPLENISRLFDIPKENTNFIYDELSRPNIGDDSRAYRVAMIGGEYTCYEIHFIKMNVSNMLCIYGTEGVDYELLKDLARIVESKISMVSEV